MSYILDALRRAEAERERGRVPGLNTPTLAGGPAAPTAGPRRWLLPWAGGGLLLLAGLAAGLWWAGGPVAAPAAPPPVAAPTATPPAVAASAPPPAASTPPRVASPYLPPAPPPAALTAMPAPVRAADPPIPRLAELPEALRRALPPLAISGSVYSDDPASRFVMVNGDVAREGARLGAELVLEEIRPRELVLRFKGQRFRQPV